MSSMKWMERDKMHTNNYEILQALVISMPTASVTSCRKEQGTDMSTVRSSKNFGKECPFSMITITDH